VIRIRAFSWCVTVTFERFIRMRMSKSIPVYSRRSKRFLVQFSLFLYLLSSVYIGLFFSTMRSNVSQESVSKMDFEGLYAASGSKPTINFISFSVMSAFSPGRWGRLFTRSVAAITTCSRSFRIFCRCSSTSFIAFSLSNDAIDSSRSKSWRCCLVKRLGTLLLLPPRRLPPLLPPLPPTRPPRRSR